MQDDAAKRWDDSLISLGLGALVVVVSGILIYNYFSGQTPNLLKQTQQANASPSTEQQIANGLTTPEPLTGAAQSSGQPTTSGNPTLPAKHTVAAGDSFWKLAEKYYGTGYEWKRIADANKEVAANGLRTGLQLEIPRAELVSSTATEKSPAPTQIAQSSPAVGGATTATATPAVTPTVAPTNSPTPTVAATSTPTASPTMIATASPTSTPSATPTVRPTNSPTPSATVAPTPSPTVRPSATATSTPSSEEKNTNEAQTAVQAPTGRQTYTVASGDSLWSIAESVCGNPYLFRSIARQNNLVTPGVIHAGNTFSFTCTQ